MPHVTVKLWPGKSEQQKEQLAEEITRDVIEVLDYDEKAVSVTFEEVSPENWAEQVYKPDILDQPENVFKKPGYNPFE